MIKDALLAPESLIDGRGGLEKKSYKRLMGWCTTNALSIWAPISTANTAVREKERKITRLMR